MKKILLYLIVSSTVLLADSARFTRNTSTNIVTDRAAHFMWQDNEDAVTIKKSWQGAIDYCEASSLGGYDDWRLPNINELNLIVEGPEIRRIFRFKSPRTYAPVYSYWSSTTYASSTMMKAWVIAFQESALVTRQFPVSKSDHRYIRCIRATEQQ